MEKRNEEYNFNPERPQIKASCNTETRGKAYT